MRVLSPPASRIAATVIRLAGALHGLSDRHLVALRVKERHDPAHPGDLCFTDDDAAPGRFDFLLRRVHAVHAHVHGDTQGHLRCRLEEATPRRRSGIDQPVALLFSDLPVEDLLVEGLALGHIARAYLDMDEWVWHRGPPFGR